MFYAMYDFTARKGNPGYGFANTKKAVAFTSKEKMNSFLHEREAYDFSSKRITRKEAMKMRDTVPFAFAKGLALDGIDICNYVILEA